jgi:hypothetical protein
MVFASARRKPGFFYCDPNQVEISEETKRPFPKEEPF